MSKRRPSLSLSNLKSRKPTAEPKAGPAPAKRKAADDGRIGTTLRLTPEAWRQLKVLAADERKSSHELIVEGLNWLFQKRGLPPIA